MDNTRLKQIGEEFGKAIAELVDRGLVRIGTVESTDESSASIVLTDSDSPISVPLQLLELEKTLIRVQPKKDSIVAVLFIEGAKNMPMLIGLTEVEEYKLQVGDSTVRVVKDLIEFNGGENSGLVLVDKLTAKLNQLKDEVSRLQSNFLSHTHTTSAGPTDTPKATPVSFSQFRSEDYKNDKITQ